MNLVAHGEHNERECTQVRSGVLMEKFNFIFNFFPCFFCAFSLPGFWNQVSIGPLLIYLYIHGFSTPKGGYIRDGFSFGFVMFCLRRFVSFSFLDSTLFSIINQWR